MRKMNDEVFDESMQLADEGRMSPAFFIADCLEYIAFLKDQRATLLKQVEKLANGKVNQN